ncbi:MAG TPA: sugar phosphate isomerase/epimerase family protein [Nitrososphaeraceae archaeon]|nr:sugar phosphate isomerase/epimerase family protein [Nitrososphaeraceae archaeon]
MNSIPCYGLLTNPSNEILGEITKIYDLDFEYVEVGIEGPEGNPLIIEKKKKEISDLLQKFKQKPIGHTAYWIDLCSDYEYVRHAWVLEAMREIKTARKIDIDLINFHANLNGMFYGEKRKMLLDNMIRSLREIVRYAHKYKIQVMLENVPLSNGIHNIDEFKYIIDNVASLFVHLDIPHAFTSGGMKSVIDYINTFRDKIVHIHWHDNHGKRDEHLPIGEGFIDHKKAVEALKGIDYDRTITLEVFTNSNDAKSSADKLRIIWR